MNALDKGKNLLDEVYSKTCRGSNVAPAIDSFVDGLQQLNESYSSNEWKNFKNICLQHDLAGIFHKDPFTRRAFKKPRGYAGDAIMLDYIYRDKSIREEILALEERACQLFDYTTTAPLSRAVKERCSIIARKIDECVEKSDSLEILSVACGHMREVKNSKYFKENKFKRCVGFDLDAISLQAVKEEYQDINIECIQGDILDLATGNVDLGTFDLIYSAGLYDYLPQPFARRLTEVMFEILNPGGKLIIGNFVKNSEDIGFKCFTEIMMDWDLVYRTVEEMENLARKIKKDQIDELEVFLEKNQHIAFLEVVKRKY